MSSDRQGTEMEATVDSIMPHTRMVRRPQQGGGSRPAIEPGSDSGGFGGCIPGDEPGDFDWGDPIPFDATPTLPDFPARLLPGVYGEMVAAIAESRSVPTALPGMILLGVLGSCYAKGWRVRGKPDWVQPTNLYVMVGMESGSRKSSVFSDIMRPVLDYEARGIESSKADFARARSRRETEEQTLKALQKKAAGSRDDAEDLSIQAEELAARLETEELPVVPRLVADDITSECLASMLHSQGGKILIASSECDIIGIMQGRYSDKRSGGVNLAPFLKGHEGDPITVNRSGGRQERIPCPLLSMAVCAQPHALAQFVKDGDLSGRGMAPRFLFAVPESGLGYRPIDTEPIPEKLKRDFGDAICRALDARDSLVNHPPNPPELPAESMGLRELALSPKAVDPLRDCLERLEVSMREEGRFGEHRAIASKLSGATLRISAILELSRDLEATQVSPHSMIDAVELVTDFLEPHELAAHGMATMGTDTKRAVSLLRWLGRHRHETFSVRQAFQGLKGSTSAIFKAKEDVSAAVERLKDYGYIIPLDSFERVNGRPGRNQSPSYVVHPGIVSGSITLPERR